ncbi:SseB family protein [Streptomyces sp. NPDC018833]|uniref:SseB family protein n=1 Tax=Streptomyces sp. NPDC018833 TaxID=3365053 RepID=UPI0037A1E620
MADNGDDIPKPRLASRLADLVYEPVPEAPPKPPTVPAVAVPTVVQAEPVDELAAGRRGFARLLGEFRRSAVLVPFDALGSLWTADFSGVRWICAFSDEEALARFAFAQGDADREWAYRTVLGARLLDSFVPMLPGPGGVALDAGSDEGMLFPPVAGIVPDAVAVDIGGMR